ncbi:hypothetical protein AX774_g491 [Zancudomyces culisetae]|uniref:BZIP domain-containing protein n=1 Tax=Zancudomyces culisetae TaxID=1213189 RepID=A0A1R1PYF2_ZANCU|nr:hypothetical protein AX774_g491 [Zancudomyces culisetae]|eukprot:OMH85949.1 hypothetical protein AX774_g491 [Zancudomyces culisetae]
MSDFFKDCIDETQLDIGNPQSVEFYYNQGNLLGGEVFTGIQDLTFDDLNQDYTIDPKNLENGGNSLDFGNEPGYMNGLALNPGSFDQSQMDSHELLDSLASLVEEQSAFGDKKWLETTGKITIGQSAETSRVESDVAMSEGCAKASPLELQNLLFDTPGMDIEAASVNATPEAILESIETFLKNRNSTTEQQTNDVKKKERKQKKTKEPKESKETKKQKANKIKEEEHEEDMYGDFKNDEEDELSKLDLKNMSSKERRQIRNKISARNFRVRRKEYIQTLEERVRKFETENDRLKQELEHKDIENSVLKRELDELRQKLETVFPTKDEESTLVAELPPSTSSSGSPTTTLPSSPLQDPGSMPIFNPHKNLGKGSSSSNTWSTSGNCIIVRPALVEINAVEVEKSPIDLLLDMGFGKPIPPSPRTILHVYMFVTYLAECYISTCSFYSHRKPSYTAPNLQPLHANA